MKSGSLIVFAHERTDARVIKRVRALADHGWAVTGFTFHRQRPGKNDDPPFRNVPLGETQDRAYAKRLFSLVKALGILWRERTTLRTVDALYAINTDNALLALATRLIVGRPLPLFVEIADIQPPFVGTGLKGRVLRWIERQVLKHTTCLVTTSPGFIREYFLPLQDYRGPLFLLENKVYPSTGLSQPRLTFPPAGPPWRIGWFGALRCQRSWDIIKRLAIRFPQHVHFVLRGYPTKINPETFLREASTIPNITFGGAYQYPDDLPDMHSELHFVWGFDFSDATANSRWLLPNRLYESGLLGVPMLAARGTETGRQVEHIGNGFSFDEETLEENLAAFLEHHAIIQWSPCQQHTSSLDVSQFVGEQDYAELSERLRKEVLKSSRPCSTPAKACA